MKYRKMFEPFNEDAAKQVVNEPLLGLSEIIFTVCLVLILAMVMYIFLTGLI